MRAIHHTQLALMQIAEQHKDAEQHKERNSESASELGRLRKLPNIRPGATTVVAPQDVASMI